MFTTDTKENTIKVYTNDLVFNNIILDGSYNTKVVRVSFP